MQKLNVTGLIWVQSWIEYDPAKVRPQKLHWDPLLDRAPTSADRYMQRSSKYFNVIRSPPLDSHR
jgi:hypothetical protein